MRMLVLTTLTDCDYVSFERASEFSTMLFFYLMWKEKKFTVKGTWGRLTNKRDRECECFGCYWWDEGVSGGQCVCLLCVGGKNKFFCVPFFDGVPEAGRRKVISFVLVLGTKKISTTWFLLAYILVECLPNHLHVMYCPLTQRDRQKMESVRDLTCGTFQCHTVENTTLTATIRVVTFSPKVFSCRLWPMYSSKSSMKKLKKRQPQVRLCPFKQ